MTTPDREQLHRVFGVTGHGSAEDAALASSRRFVRGRTQISPLESDRHPKGHIISAFEALQSYGVDVLDEAVEYGSAILLQHPNAVGKALRRQREALGLEVSAVSRSTGVHAADVQRIEAGPAADLPMQTVERVAFILGLDEAQIAFQEKPGGAAVAARLKTLQAQSPAAGLPKLSRRTVTAFAEAASVIRVQHRLQQWLGISGSAATFHPSHDFGSHTTPHGESGMNLPQKPAINWAWGKSRYVRCGNLCRTPWAYQLCMRSYRRESRAPRSPSPTERRGVYAASYSTRWGPTRTPWSDEQHSPMRSDTFCSTRTRISTTCESTPMLDSRQTLSRVVPSISLNNERTRSRSACSLPSVSSARESILH